MAEEWARPAQGASGGGRPERHQPEERLRVAAEMAKEAWEPPCFPPNLFAASFPRPELLDHHLPWTAVSDKCAAHESEQRELFLNHSRESQNPIDWMKFLKGYRRIGNWWYPNSCRWSAANCWLSEMTSSMRRNEISTISKVPWPQRSCRCARCFSSLVPMGSHP